MSEQVKRVNVGDIVYFCDSDVGADKYISRGWHRVRKVHPTFDDYYLIGICTYWWNRKCFMNIEEVIKLLEE